MRVEAIFWQELNKYLQAQSKLSVCKSLGGYCSVFLFYMLKVDDGFQNDRNGGVIVYVVA